MERTIEQALSPEFPKVSLKELHMINILRKGLSTDFSEETIKLRVKFLVEDKVFHKPIINNHNSPYHIKNKEIYFEDTPTSILVHQIEEDTPDPYYFRGKSILVINSTPFNPCNQGCLFCEQSLFPDDKKRYSKRVCIKDLFDKVEKDVEKDIFTKLLQISIITSCTGNEIKTLDLFEKYYEEAMKRGFKGKFLLATNEIRSLEGLQRLTSFGRIILAFTVECFENRKNLMPGYKGQISLEKIKDILSKAKSLGLETTYFYITGLDSLKGMKRGFLFLRDSVSIAPCAPIYYSQSKQDLIPIRDLEYFIKAREIYNTAHKGILSFESCQVYCSLYPLEGKEEKLIIK